MQDIEEIYKQHFKTVYKYLFCLTHDENLAEELTQETFYRAVTKINEFKGECKTQVWLCQIAKNLLYDEIKKRDKHENINDELNLISNQYTEKKVIDNAEKLELFKRMQMLDEQTKEVIYLRLTGELSFREIADILNQTETWARVVFYRGKKKLKDDRKHNDYHNRLSCVEKT